MGSNTFVCQRCGNSDPRYFGYKNKEPYCRLCVTFLGKEAREYKVDDSCSEPVLDFPLSTNQSDISRKVLENFKNNKSTLIHAVCGSGKTELVYGIISYAISLGMHIGFAVPRREVVIDLYPRFKGSYPNHKVITVYGGHTNTLEGDIILLTTHQLYRYTNYFDLLIVDEIDAFPFKDNNLLMNLFKRSIKGNFVFMSATPPDEIVNDFKKNNNPILELHTRYHRHALPVPINKVRIGYLKILFIIKKIKEYKKEKKQVMIFTPTIKRCEEIYFILNLFIKKGSYVHSKCEDRNQRIKDFKSKKFDYLVTTSVLERGVTIKNIQVIIYDADNAMYNKGVLIQISGRVGRKIDAPDGDVYFLANKVTKEMKDAINEIKKDNSYLTM